ncbi:hypothetical protein L218DRAFT_987953 [Marasmius fiardii PR-910]|nr:hypothetical protein L218DRAFT_987953 [Marasmius fiardii PR-910]
MTLGNNPMDGIPFAINSFTANPNGNSREGTQGAQGAQQGSQLLPQQFMHPGNALLFNGNPNFPSPQSFPFWPNSPFPPYMMNQNHGQDVIMSDNRVIGLAPTQEKEYVESLDDKWVVHKGTLEYEHIHADNTRCHEHADHIAKAYACRIPSFMAARADVISMASEPIAHELKQQKSKSANLEKTLKEKTVAHTAALKESEEKFKAAKAENVVLKQENEVLWNQLAQRECSTTSTCGRPVNNRSYHGSHPYLENRHRNPHSDIRVVDNRGLHSSRHTSLVTTTVVLNYDNMVLPFTNKDTEFTIIENCQYHLGDNHSLLPMSWDMETGMGFSSQYVTDCIRNNDVPIPIQYPGVVGGFQAMPKDRDTLHALITASAQPHHWIELHQVRLLFIMGQVLELATSSTPDINPFHGIEKDALLLCRDCRPSWHTFSAWTNDSELSLPGNVIPKTWATDAIVTIPFLGPPPGSGRPCYQQWGEFIMVHYEPINHAGFIASDLGSFDLESVHSIHFLIETSPRRFPHDKKVHDAYRVAFVSLFSKAGYYQQLLTAHGVDIASKLIFIHVETKDYSSALNLAKHFARCSVTTDIADSFIRFTWQLCLDMQANTSINPSICSEFINLLQQACFRAFFFPITSPATNSEINQELVPENYKVPRFPLAGPDSDLASLNISSMSLSTGGATPSSFDNKFALLAANDGNDEDDRGMEQ